MFDVGFWEICLVGLVSLLVLGPERLPKAARFAGYWIGKTRNTVATVKDEIQHELREEEIRQALQQQQQHLDNFQDSISEQSKAMKSKLHQSAQTTEHHERE